MKQEDRGQGFGNRGKGKSSWPSKGKGKWRPYGKGKGKGKKGSANPKPSARASTRGTTGILRAQGLDISDVIVTKDIREAKKSGSSEAYHIGTPREDDCRKLIRKDLQLCRLQALPDRGGKRRIVHSWRQTATRTDRRPRSSIRSHRI